ncbi:MAG TPA: VapC toxin family PIN domain ribonuclease [Planctomycetaceae bacterium]|nr:VapC toxin family PIN domain ribonuclease [Planctomycetaceae bacterium]
MTDLLDTNVWITVLRKSNPHLANRFRATAPDRIKVCSIVVAELRHGCLRSAKPEDNRAAVDALLAPITSLPFDDSAAEQFARIRHTLEQDGRMIGPLDAQIAAIALANHCVLVTHNSSEFSRIPRLLIEDWQRT